MGSTSGGWEVFQDDGKQFRRKDTKREYGKKRKGMGTAAGLGK